MMRAVLNLKKLVVFSSMVKQVQISHVLLLHPEYILLLSVLFV